MGLRPSLLDDLGILAAMSWFIREHHKAYPDITLKEQITVREEEIPEPIKIVLFRTLQAAMENVAQHSRATTACVCLRRVDRKIELCVEDNGVGFSPTDASSGEEYRGIGLAVMQERVESSGGAVTVRSVKGEGTLIRAVWDIGEAT
jgi:signal transduction histidine kinase